MPLSVSDGLSAWIKDFMKSDAPQFKGKTKEEIVKMAIAAYTDAGGKLKKEEKMKNFKDIREKFKVQNYKGYPRITDIYVQFRGGKGDRITSPENRRDFTSAVKMTLQFLKKNKLKSKPVFSTPEEGSSAYKVSLTLNKQEEKTADLTPLANALAVLRTSEDHGMAWAKPVGESVSEKAYTKDEKLVQQAVGIALQMGGNMTGAYKKIEKLKRGLGNHPVIKAALKIANESVNEGVFSVKLDKPYKRGDEKMYMDIIKKYGGKNLKFSPPNRRDPELDIFFDGGDVKKITSNLPNKGKAPEWISD